MAKIKIIDFFTRSKVIFVAIAGVVTFTITLYNQFKTSKYTEISGTVSSSRDLLTPVDAVVKLSSPIQGQTETDSHGRFKFKIENLKSDTFLLIIQNKKSNLETKQSEWINSGEGKNNIIVYFNADVRDGRVYSPLGKNGSMSGARKTPDLIKMIQHTIHAPKIRQH